jgi:hypothetical protein
MERREPTPWSSGSEGLSSLRLLGRLFSRFDLGEA